ncbi:hypothetical protein ABZU75_03150 [Streptosporangium sp. NPDC005286]|uniref:hypothetical protein n=1 Tax=Streptosporangium sp. NPDC005286 TaxID=3154463 RepID=UPI0033A32F7B
MDGKTLHGQPHRRHRVHLLATARNDDRTVIAQHQIATRSGEIPAFTSLLSSPHWPSAR